MTREKAIEILKEQIANEREFQDRYLRLEDVRWSGIVIGESNRKVEAYQAAVQALDNAVREIELLEKLEEWWKNRYTVIEMRDTGEAEVCKCPKCEKAEINARDRYCWWCGQAFEWKKGDGPTG